MADKNKCIPLKTLKRNHSSNSDLSSSDEEQKAKNRKTGLTIGEGNFPRFLVIELIENKKMGNLSPFLIEKVLSTKSNPKMIKKTKDGNLLVEITNLRDAQSLLKMKNFHEYKCKVFPHKTLNTSKGVVRSYELSLATEEEIKTELAKQGVTNHIRINIKRNDKIITTNTYILTFNSPTIPKEIKIGYLNVKVEQYIPAPLRCFHCQKYGHHKEACKGIRICGKCGNKEPDHTEEECINEVKCANCREDHPVFSKICKTYKKEKEIIEVKYKKNTTFPEARKIVETYMKENTYAETTKKTTKPCQHNETPDQYKELINKLITLNIKEWPEFQNSLKEKYSNLGNKIEITNPRKESNIPSTTEKGKKISQKPAKQPPEINKNISNNKTANKERSRKEGNQTIDTQNRFQILEKMETESTPDKKEKSNTSNQEGKNEQETKTATSQTRPRSTSRSKQKKEKTQQDTSPKTQTPTKDKPSTSKEMEIEEIEQPHGYK